MAEEKASGWYPLACSSLCLFHSKARIMPTATSRAPTTARMIGSPFGGTTSTAHLSPFQPRLQEHVNESSVYPQVPCPVQFSEEQLSWQNFPPEATQTHPALFPSGLSLHVPVPLQGCDSESLIGHGTSHANPTQLVVQLHIHELLARTMV